MKRHSLYILIHTIFICTALLSAENKPVKRIEQLNRNLLLHLKRLHQHDDFDTLAHSYDQPLGYFEEPFQRLIEATKLRPQSKCRLYSIHIAFYNDINGTVSKDVEFYLWKNRQGLPGNLIYSEQKRVRMNESGFQWFRLDLSDTLIYLEGDFWIGHKELTSGFPTSVIDGIQTNNRTNFYAENGMEWFEEEYDYLQMAVVQYSEFGEPEIAITPDTLLFQVTTISDSNDDDDDQSPEIVDIRTNYFESDVDTLSNEYIPPFFPFYEKYRTAYESTRLFAPRTAVVKKIL
ncbi:hypothetical protein GF337_06900, partial [candidate division KSB1 bacterium]|nr:hypothetical protein [candidate division KSB1 bacterium]